MQIALEATTELSRGGTSQRLLFSLDNLSDGCDINFYMILCISRTVRST